eukprot:CAMPEP_0168494254 /NCGR_PEP_ID=MMETSP0228-20121227/71136_1 /TAXON_ID=133427 /ORGANISM="Protoceratium reticulatum, Strain CCCM 535 (=CCMP 1889)" /LENGTH=39 /DNA_ID= /DNA_START= /DNA_END= /DNA_ORIENTATION=
MTQATKNDLSNPQGIVAMCEDGAASPLFDLDMHDEIVFT